jgi:hypothetical protein
MLIEVKIAWAIAKNKYVTNQPARILALPLDIIAITTFKVMSTRCGA